MTGIDNGLEDWPPSAKSVQQVYEEIRGPLQALATTVIAECRNAEPKASGWTFDLVTVSGERTFVLPARVWNAELATIKRAFDTAGENFRAAMIDGMELEVSGQLRMWPETGDIYLKVTDISSHFSLNGAMLLKDRQTLQTLKAEFPCHSRLHADDDAIYEDAKDGFSLGRLRKITVISPEKSQGVEDFKHHLSIAKSGEKPEITYRHMSLGGQSAAATLRDFCDEARRNGHDLVVITRGGGHWRSMRGFQDEGLARAILESPVPVITGIGHRQDVSIVDRAATASFTTPTAAAVAITTPSVSAAAPGKKYPTSFKESLGAERRKVARLEREVLSMRQSLAHSHDELASANAALRRYEADLTAGNGALRKSWASHIASDRQHGLDLLELARLRVRGYSWLLTLATLGLAVTFVVNSTLIAIWLTGSDDHGLGLWLAIGTVALTVFALLAQFSSRKHLNEKHKKPLKQPPVTVREWEIRIMNVRTVRALRKLLHHIPVG
ncbi:exodeoxyribonuclease VII large subunit [Arthrobacter sp. LFS091]|uniref:exodeoxyribonuclease VII large subunit n=1 Tax=Arthrobacter sp. LFS091 TaxID=3229892 RepID=UPI003A8077A2